MKLSKFILLFIILITSVEANTIYNLIKIPNLEIYKSDSKNGIKYLKASKPFQVGIRNDNVTCFNSDNKNIKKKFNLIKKNLDKYNYNFLDKINLKYIVLCENLSVSGINSAGVPNYKMKTLIIDINFKEDYFERVIHHEIFHLINDSYGKTFLVSVWKDINNPNFQYAKCSTCSSRLNLELINKTDGFLTEYSMSTASEDMAEVFSFLMTDRKKIENKAINDQILTKKILFIKKNIFKIDENFKF